MRSRQLLSQAVEAHVDLVVVGRAGHHAVPQLVVVGRVGALVGGEVQRRPALRGEGVVGGGVAAWKVGHRRVEVDRIDRAVEVLLVDCQGE